VKRGRRLWQTRRESVARRWPIMRWYQNWTDLVMKQRRFKRWFVGGRPFGDRVHVAELWEFDRSQWPVKPAEQAGKE